ncbi:hypothetical protein PIIN_10849 [Serendipita indica DSM 11827]|uniref:Uncharacterized protein n=1 Tax=Serendipita indica (strain DSM 11827) TaxID=1109443 RepID=G4TZX1_SERID|nr:hypothetical protein PIIN_10849 [Serendipita indica DSM 11827]
MKKQGWLEDNMTITTVPMADICRQAAEKAGVSQEAKHMLKAFSFVLKTAAVDPLLESFNKTATAKLDSLVDATKLKL